MTVAHWKLTLSPCKHVVHRPRREPAESTICGFCGARRHVGRAELLSGDEAAIDRMDNGRQRTRAYRARLRAVA